MLLSEAKAEILEAIPKGDLCSVRNVLRKKSFKTQFNIDLLRLAMQAAGANPSQEMFEIISTIYNKDNFPNESKVWPIFVQICKPDQDEYSRDLVHWCCENLVIPSFTFKWMVRTICESGDLEMLRLISYCICDFSLCLTALAGAARAGMVDTIDWILSNLRYADPIYIEAAIKCMGDSFYFDGVFNHTYMGDLHILAFKKIIDYLEENGIKSKLCQYPLLVRRIEEVCNPLIKYAAAFC